MDKINQNKYETPTIEVVEIQVEQGFATSQGGNPEPNSLPGFSNGPSWGF